MKITSVKLVAAYDHELGSKLLINDQVVASQEYETSGGSGRDILEAALKNIAALANVFPQFEEIEDEEFIDL